jgi:hypothetical protein
MVRKSVAVPLNQHFPWPIHPSFAALSGWLNSANKWDYLNKFCKIVITSFSSTWGLSSTAFSFSCIDFNF